MDKMRWTLNNISDMKNKHVIVTGANSGLGYESVKALAAAGANLIVASRNMEKGQLAKIKILSEYPEANMEVMLLDLMDLSSVRAFVKEYSRNHSSLDVLLNNAGIMTTPYHKTKDGFEAQLGTNHLGHFALTGLLLPLLKNTPGSRVVTVSSLAHRSGKMNFSDIMFTDGKDYTPMKAYGQSKLANLLFSHRLQKYFEEKGFDSIAVSAHPGVSQTNLFRYMENKAVYKIFKSLFEGFTQSADMGALPQLRAATDPQVKGGEFYGPDGKGEMKGYPLIVEPKPHAQDDAAAEKLWIMSQRLTGIQFS